MRGVFGRYCQRYDTWYDRNRFAYLSELEAVKKVLPRRGKGLEVGVGTGRFAGPLGIGYGLDPSKEMLDVAKKRGVKIKKGFGERLAFKDGDFDYAAIIITLCFVMDPGRVLKEAHRVLRKGGRIILGIVDKDSFLGRFYKRKKSLFYKKARFFNVKEVTDMLRKAGFSGFSRYQTLYRLPGEMRSVHRPRRGSGRGGFVVVSGVKK